MNVLRFVEGYSVLICVNSSVLLPVLVISGGKKL